jgi:hypothetical protein
MTGTHRDNTGTCPAHYRDKRDTPPLGGVRCPDEATQGREGEVLSSLWAYVKATQHKDARP